MLNFAPDPVITRTNDGRITMDERGATAPQVAIEVLREMVALHNLTVDLYEWAVEVNSQGTGEADDLLLAVRKAIQRYERPDTRLDMATGRERHRQHVLTKD